MTQPKEKSELIKNLKPRLNEGVYVFAVVAEFHSQLIDHSFAVIQEKEGVTLVMEKTKATDLGLRYNFEAAWITLGVHSSLEDVGLTAAVSKAMADAGISCNVIAAYFHDHLFVPHDRAAEVVYILNNLSKKTTH